MKRRFFGWMWVVGWVLVSGGVVAQEEYTLEEKIGQLLLLGFRGLELSADSEVLEHIRLGKVGGIILFDYDVINKEFVRNIASAEQVRALIAWHKWADLASDKSATDEQKANARWSFERAERISADKSGDKTK